MHVCDICNKKTGNGVLVRVNGRKIKICASCLQFDSGTLVANTREVMRTGKKGKRNGVVEDADILQRKLGEAWAAFWTPDCEDVKTKTKARKAKGAKK